MVPVHFFVNQQTLVMTEPQSYVNSIQSWVSAVLSTTAGFILCCHKQLLENTQKIRNLIPFWCKIKLPNKNFTNQKEKGFLIAHFTSNTYTLKREILSFSNKISRNLPKPDRKVIADINYGLLASGSCLLTDIVDQLIAWTFEKD